MSRSFLSASKMGDQRSKLILTPILVAKDSHREFQGSSLANLEKSGVRLIKRGVT